MLVEIAIGAAAAALAIAARKMLPLEPDQLPFLTSVLALTIVTLTVGTLAGTVCAVTAGLAAWYYFFVPNSWLLTHGASISVIGYVVVAVVIITTCWESQRNARLRVEQRQAELQRQAEAAELFARELAHRLKNKMAIVQSLVRQTLDPEAAETHVLLKRLAVLADASSLLADHVSMPTAGAAEVIERTIAPFRHDDRRFVVTDVSARLATNEVLMFSLALHELCTNAVKYGALSVPCGRVTIDVHDVEDQLIFNWSEYGGPAVSPPVSEGFGSRLLRRSGLGAQVSFDPKGVRCTMKMPITRVSLADAESVSPR